MIRFMNSFLSDRFMRVRVCIYFVFSFYRVKEGVLQGSVLSNACFAVTIYSIIDEVSGPACASLFVDELSIFFFFL